MAASQGKQGHLQLLRASGEKAPLFCVHAVAGNIAEYQDFVAAMQADRPSSGLRPPKLEGTQDFFTIEELAARYVGELRTLITRIAASCTANHSGCGL